MSQATGGRLDPARRRPFVALDEQNPAPGEDCDVLPVLKLQAPPKSKCKRQLPLDSHIQPSPSVCDQLTAAVKGTYVNTWTFSNSSGDRAHRMSTCDYLHSHDASFRFHHTPSSFSSSSSFSSNFSPKKFKSYYEPKASQSSMHEAGVSPRNVSSVLTNPDKVYRCISEHVPIDAGTTSCHSPIGKLPPSSFKDSQKMALQGQTELNKSFLHLASSYLDKPSQCVSAQSFACKDTHVRIRSSLASRGMTETAISDTHRLELKWLRQIQNNQPDIFVFPDCVIKECANSQQDQRRMNKQETDEVLADCVIKECANSQQDQRRLNKRQTDEVLPDLRIDEYFSSQPHSSRINKQATDEPDGLSSPMDTDDYSVQSNYRKVTPKDSMVSILRPQDPVTPHCPWYMNNYTTLQSPINEPCMLNYDTSCAHSMTFARDAHGVGVHNDNHSEQDAIHSNRTMAALKRTSLNDRHFSGTFYELGTHEHGDFHREPSTWSSVTEILDTSESDDISQYLEDNESMSSERTGKSQSFLTKSDSNHKRVANNSIDNKDENNYSVTTTADTNVCYISLSSSISSDDMEYDYEDDHTTTYRSHRSELGEFGDEPDGKAMKLVWGQKTNKMSSGHRGKSLVARHAGSPTPATDHITASECHQPTHEPRDYPLNVSLLGKPQVILANKDSPSRQKMSFEVEDRKRTVWPSDHAMSPLSDSDNCIQTAENAHENQQKHHHHPSRNNNMKLLFPEFAKQQEVVSSDTTAPAERKHLTNVTCKHYQTLQHCPHNNNNDDSIINQHFADEVDGLGDKKTNHADSQTTDTQTKSAREKFDPQTASAREKFDPQTASAREKFDPQTASAREKFDPQTASAREKFDPQTASAREKVDTQTASAREKFDPQTASAREKVEEASVIYCFDRNNSGSDTASESTVDKMADLINETEAAHVMSSARSTLQTRHQPTSFVEALASCTQEMLGHLKQTPEAVSNRISQKRKNKETNAQQGKIQVYRQLENTFEREVHVNVSYKKQTDTSKKQTVVCQSLDVALPRRKSDTSVGDVAESSICRSQSSPSKLGLTDDISSDRQHVTFHRPWLDPSIYQQHTLTPDNTSGPPVSGASSRPAISGASSWSSVSGTFLKRVNYPTNAECLCASSIQPVNSDCSKVGTTRNKGNQFSERPTGNTRQSKDDMLTPSKDLSPGACAGSSKSLQQHHMRITEGRPKRKLEFSSHDSRNQRVRAQRQTKQAFLCPSLHPREPGGNDQEPVSHEHETSGDQRQEKTASWQEEVNPSTSLSRQQGDESRPSPRSDDEVDIRVQITDVFHESTRLLQKLEGIYQADDRSCVCSRIEQNILKAALDMFRALGNETSSREFWIDQLQNTNDVINKTLDLAENFRRLCRHGRQITDVFSGSIFIRIKCRTVLSLVDLCELQATGDLNAILYNILSQSALLERRGLTLRVTLDKDSVLTCQGYLLTQMNKHFKGRSGTRRKTLKKMAPARGDLSSADNSLYPSNDHVLPYHNIAVELCRSPANITSIQPPTYAFSPQRERKFSFGEINRTAFQELNISDVTTPTSPCYGRLMRDEACQILTKSDMILASSGRLSSPKVLNSPKLLPSPGSSPLTSPRKLNVCGIISEQENIDHNND